MNIVLYGISEELAQRTAMHYGFALCRPFETGTEEENRFWLQPRLENEEELLAFIERMAQHDEQIAAVVAAPTEASTETPMGDFNAVLYATRTRAVEVSSSSIVMLPSASISFISLRYSS